MYRIKTISASPCLSWGDQAVRRYGLSKGHVGTPQIPIPTTKCPRMLTTWDPQNPHPNPEVPKDAYFWDSPAAT